MKKSGAQKDVFSFGQLKLDDKGLIPAIIQDYKDGAVLMLGYMNPDSLRRTIKSGKTCFWSRSRNKFWVKGETSGHFQIVKSIAYDCDVDALLIKVRQVGDIACHTGKRSCFYRKININGAPRAKASGFPKRNTARPNFNRAINGAVSRPRMYKKNG